MRAVAVLVDDVRRALYDHVRRADRPVTRESAAEEVGISRKLAAFHLDKLVRAGLLSATTTSPTASVGRRPKAYEPAAVDVAVAIPERRPDALVEILMEGVLRSEPGSGAAAETLRAAQSTGIRLGESERRHGRYRAMGFQRALTLSVSMLERYGFEPVQQDRSTVGLRNCPFRPFADSEPGLICGISHALLSGYLDGLGAEGIEANLDPRPGWCCVRLRASPAVNG